MTTASADDGTPRAQLSRTRGLARRVRHEQRATWLPLLVFGAVTLLAIPITRSGHAVGITCRTVNETARPVARACVAHNSAAYVYWPIALVAAYGVIAAFHVYRARAIGLGTRIRPYVVAGVILAAAVTLASIWAGRTVLVGEYDLLGWHLQAPDVYRLTAPACAIGLALLVLAVLDRSAALVVVTIAYLAVAIGGVTLGWTIARPSPWSFAPHLVLAGGLLLLAAAGFALVQVPRAHESSGA